MNKKQIVPWIVVGIIGVVAIIAAIMLVLSLRPVTTTGEPGTSSATAPVESGDASQEPSTSVDAGASTWEGTTSALEIGAWQLDADVPTDLGSHTAFRITNGSSTLMFTSDADAALPDSCSALRGGWGIQRSDTASDGARQVGDYYYSLISPSGECAEAADSVTELNAMFASIVQSLRPAS